MPESSPNAKFPNHSDNSALEPERQRFEALLSNLHSQVQGKENATITVQAGRSIIYRGVPGQDPLPKDILTETILKVLQAVENPQASNGTVKLSVNGDVAFYNQKGNVAEDTYKLAEQREVAQKPEVAQSSQLEAVQPTGDIEQLKGRVDWLEALVATQQQHIHLLEQRTNVIGSAPILKVGNKLGNWLEDVRNKVGKTLQQTGEHLSKRMEQDKNLLESYKTALHTARQEIASAYNQVQTAYDKGADRHHAVNNAVFKAAQGVAAQVVDVAKYANAVVAKHQSPSTLASTSQIPKEPPVFRASDLWKHYSEKVNVMGPFQTATAVAQAAWREGVAEADIRKILAANPVLERFCKKAQELVELPLKQVTKAVQLADKSSAQQSKPITYFPNADR